MSTLAKSPPRSLPALVMLVEANVSPIETGDGWVRPELDAMGFIRRLEREEGARYRKLPDDAGYELRLGGITTTCTSSRRQLLRNWLAAAERKLGRRP